MARPNGIVVAGALAAGILVRRHPTRADLSRAVAVAGPAVLAVAVWMGFLWHWTGDPFVFAKAKEAWDEITVVEVVRMRLKWPLPHLLLGVAALGAVWLGRRI